MLRALLIGLVSGSRSMTPLAVTIAALRRGRLPDDNGAPPILNTPLASTGMAALAVGEVLGDKWEKAPDRIVPLGIAARVIMASLAAAALSPRRERRAAMALAAAASVASSFVTWKARMACMRRYGQTSTGLVEDALTLAAATLVVGSSPRPRARA